MTSTRRKEPRLCVCGSRWWLYSDAYGKPYPRDYKMCAVCARTNSERDQSDVIFGRRVHVDPDAVADELTDAHLALGGIPLNVCPGVRPEPDRDGLGLADLRLRHKTSVAHP